MNIIPPRQDHETVHYMGIEITEQDRRNLEQRLAEIAAAEARAYVESRDIIIGSV